MRFAAVLFPIDADLFDLALDAADLIQALLGGEEVVAPHRLVLFRVEALDLVLLFFDARRAVVAVQAGAAGGLVDEVDGLVGQEPVGDVAVGKARRGDDRLVGDGDLVVRLVLVAQAAQDLDGLLYAGLLDDDGGEPALEGGVLFDIFAVFVDGGGADGLQFAARQHGL